MSAAIYMGRFLRDTVVLDDCEGRSTTEQVNDNYLGFPNGVKAQELRRLGRLQAERFGVKFVDCTVDRLEGCLPTEDLTESQRDSVGGSLNAEGAHHGCVDDFIAYTSEGNFVGRSVILCTGVSDVWPEIQDLWEHVGKNLFWCISCDGFRALNKEVVIYGRDEDAAVTACQFNLYTQKINFIVPPGGLKCSDDRMTALQDNKISLIEGVPTVIETESDRMTGVRLADGNIVQGEVMFSLLGAVPNNKLALDLGLECSPQGFVKVDEEGYTTVPGVFAAGDLSRMHTHQVITAAAEGAEAAQTANYYLYADYQKLHVDDPTEKPEQLAGT